MFSNIIKDYSEYYVNDYFTKCDEADELLKTVELVSKHHKDLIKNTTELYERIRVLSDENVRFLKIIYRMDAKINKNRPLSLLSNL